jgi:hypothetical protein
VIGATQDHVFDDERSPLRELDLLVEQQRAVGGRVASPDIYHVTTLGALL